MSQYHVIQKLCSLIGVHDEVNYGNSVVWFDVSVDKQLVVATDKHGDAWGTQAITDRHKLYESLHRLDSLNNYEYIILDVMFSDDAHSPIDDSLFNLISNMDRIVVAKSDNPTTYKGMKDKMASVEFLITPTSNNFSRFQYIQFDRMDSVYVESLPLKVYKETEPTKGIQQYGSGLFTVYTCDGRLCNNTNFLTFGECTEEGEKIGNDLVAEKKFKLGHEILNTTFDFESNCENAIIVICNIDNESEDVHDTYVGKKHGALILMRAIQTLKEGQHYVPWFLTMCWFVLYLVISFTILNPNLKNKPTVRRFIKSSFLRFVCSIVTYTLVITFASLIEYVAFDRIESVIVPIIYFPILKMFVQFRRFDKYENC